MKTSRALRALLTGEQAGVLLEAHDTASALVAERAGVQGIWASSLTLSCANGYRDDSTLGMAGSLDRLEAMAERLDIPIVFDGDAGYGDFAHTEQLVRRLCARGVAGVTIEDKRMPKRNSFIGSEQQRLAPIAEFCGKIAAAKDVQRDPDFVVVARTEALIVGAGLDAALQRAERYAEAGADAVLVHCKDPVFDRVEGFMRMWSGAAPVVIVPTTYADTSVERFDAAGIKLVIWANHALRAAVRTVGRLAAHVARHRTVIGAPVALGRVSDLFALQDVAAFAERERRFSGRATPGEPEPTSPTVAHPLAPPATAGQVLDALDAAGVGVVSGVPCSLLGGLVSEATAAGRYVTASVEGEAVALCAGAWLAGGFGAALMQSSGLGNAVNPVASLLQPYRIPALLIVSWRGEPGVDDAVHQRPMGRAVPTLLDALDIPWAIIESGDRVASQIAGLSDRARREGGPVALLVPKRAAMKAEARPPELARVRPAAEVHRFDGATVPLPDALRAVCAALPGWRSVSTTGHISRALAAVDDQPHRFYMQGSMGFAPAIALGLRRIDDRPTVVLDGDGALLMRLGGLATVGARAPKDFVHVVLDNGAYGSTGGQRCASGGIDLPAVAAACGYVAAVDAGGPGLGAALAWCRDRARAGPVLLRIPVVNGAAAPRPALAPPAIARRVRRDSAT